METLERDPSAVDMPEHFHPERPLQYRLRHPQNRPVRKSVPGLMEVMGAEEEGLEAALEVVLEVALVVAAAVDTGEAMAEAAAEEGKAVDAGEEEGTAGVEDVEVEGEVEEARADMEDMEAEAVDLVEALAEASEVDLEAATEEVAVEEKVAAEDLEEVAADTEARAAAMPHPVAILHLLMVAPLVAIMAAARAAAAMSAVDITERRNDEAASIENISTFILTPFLSQYPKNAPQGLRDQQTEH